MFYTFIVSFYLFVTFSHSKLIFSLSFTRSFFHSFNRRVILPLIHLPIHSPTYANTHPSHFSVQPFTYSLLHLLLQYVERCGHIASTSMKNISAILSTEVVFLFAGTVKEGSPTKNVLEHLSKKISVDWRTLGRRLSFDEADLQEFDRGHEEISEKAYAMLLRWKQRKGSDATYRVLNNALRQTLVNRTDLAQEFCCFTEQGF